MTRDRMILKSLLQWVTGMYRQKVLDNVYLLCVYSITAGLAAINVKTKYVSPEQFVEFRGKGFIMGGV